MAQPEDFRKMRSIEVQPDEQTPGRIVITAVSSVAAQTLRQWYMDCSITGEQEVSLSDVVRH
jgi:hypothetical protein